MTQFLREDGDADGDQLSIKMKAVSKTLTVTINKSSLYLFIKSAALSKDIHPQ